ncbi:MAG: hypothetical protein AAGI45_19490 [Cyanobacteria bacterium P01_H01_bin.26]
MTVRVVFMVPAASAVANCCPTGANATVEFSPMATDTALAPAAMPTRATTIADTTLGSPTTT